MGFGVYIEVDADAGSGCFTALSVAALEYAKKGVPCWAAWEATPMPPTCNW
jgi:hypothetical protein